MGFKRIGKRLDSSQLWFNTDLTLCVFFTANLYFHGLKHIIYLFNL